MSVTINVPGQKKYTTKNSTKDGKLVEGFRLIFVVKSAVLGHRIQKQ